MAITITSIVPTTGSVNGGTAVAITGTGLTAVNKVFFGSADATIDTTQTNTAVLLHVIAPAVTTPGVVPVTILDTVGNQEAQLAAAYTYAAATAAAQLTSVPASKWKMDVDTSVAQDGSAWTQVRGITDFQPQLNTTTQDDSDYDSGTWGSDAKTQLKWQNTLKVSRKRGANYVEDAGQAALRLASDKVGTAGTVSVRWYDRNGHGSEAYSGSAMVQWSEDGGNTTALSSVSVTLMGQGPRTPIANPIS